MRPAVLRGGAATLHYVQHLAPAPAPHGKPMPLLEVTSRKWAQGALLSCEMIPLDDATNPHSVD